MDIATLFRDDALRVADKFAAVLKGQICGNGLVATDQCFKPGLV